MIKTLVMGASLSVLVLAHPAQAASANASSAWQAAIGDTSAIQTQSKGGAGILIGVVDTGIIASNPEVSGRVSSLSACAATSFSCAGGYADNNGHGTATASIAAGQFNSRDQMSGVAPAAMILSEKVLAASGSGTDQDVANGIIRAANAGAQVINLSLTYIPTPTVASAINYATSKGAVLVWAGGNSSAALNGGAATTGLTSAALTHIVFVGSVNNSGALSSFSNTPGSGAIQIGTTRTSYASLWMVAPGENIVAPGIQYGANAYANWSGTSMAAPVIAGSIALLEATWPVLARNGTATTVLIDTATDLGAKGTDSTYGVGEVNLVKAFQPIGTLTVNAAGGKVIAVSQLSGALIAGGALGQLSAIKSSLANYTAFDSFQRNFSVNLSNLVSVNSQAFSSLIATQIAPTVISRATHLANGATLDMAASSFAFDADPASALAARTFGPRDPGVFYLSLTSPRGTTGAVGRGLGSSASFANALWGAGTPAAWQAESLGVSNALMNLAQGGYFGAFGTRIGGRARLAVSFTQSLTAQDMSVANGGLRAASSAVEAGASLNLARGWTAGLTVTSLSERDSVLGASYVSGGPLTLGDSHRSASVGVNSRVELGGGRSLMFDATMARTSAAMGAGVVGQVSTLTSRGYGVSLLQTDALIPGDRLTVSLRKPLRVVAGWAELAQTTVDSQGYPTTTLARFSLRPDGNETDVALGYAARLSQGADLSAGLNYRADAENVRGLTDVALRLAAAWRF